MRKVKKQKKKKHERSALTVVKVDDSRVSGDAGVKVRHERSDVLCCRQHPMDHVAGVDEP